MDLQSIRENLRQKKYQNREEFLADVDQIVKNSARYNGEKSSLTIAAQRMLNKCIERLEEKEDRLMRLEKAINPLLDSDQVALTFILENVLNCKLKALSVSWPFLKPVNKKLVKDYYTVVKRPIDLETMSKKAAMHKYHSRHEFLADIQQILENCILYNGKDSPFTQKAETLVNICKFTLAEYDEHLTQLEAKIALAQEHAYQDEDHTWLDVDEENYTIAEPDQMSLASSPENPYFRGHMEDYDYIDVEGPGPYSDTGSNPIKTKRGRGRPRKKLAATLEEDLQFSSEEELDEVPLNEFEDVKAGILISAEMPNEPCNDDDSQQVAEAMVQLGTMGYYHQSEMTSSMIFKEESMDVDPNYDPSDFLMSGLPMHKNEVIQTQSAGMEIHNLSETKIHDDLAVSDSEEEEEEMHSAGFNDSQHIQDEEDVGDGDLWF